MHLAACLLLNLNNLIAVNLSWFSSLSNLICVLCGLIFAGLCPYLFCVVLLFFINSCISVFYYTYEVVCSVRREETWCLRWLGNMSAPSHWFQPLKFEELQNQGRSNDGVLFQRWCCYEWAKQGVKYQRETGQRYATKFARRSSLCRKNMLDLDCSPP